MIFTSFAFILFFICFFLLYWFVFNKNLKLQNFLILTGSYFFYAWFDWRFLALLITSSFFSFFIGIYMVKTPIEKHRKILFSIGVIQALGVLIFFKYFNFFINSFIHAFSLFNISINIHILKIILPLGISFYTFRILSYLLDINKGKIAPNTDWILFFSYVAFFPSLISGPIDRSSNLIPQLERIRTFHYSMATDGLRQILWGLFKKTVVADNCAVVTNQVFSNYLSLPASSLLLGLFYFTIQLYADFSGYSDMAIGFARLLGFNITKNFDFPFFSQSLAEFWRKWHISLTSWLTDYIFTPLTIAFRDYGNYGLSMAILINFTAIGIWHGANWTYILFGLLHGCFLIIFLLRSYTSQKRINKVARNYGPFRKLINIITTFTLVMLSFILFRAESVGQAFHYFINLFSFSLFSIPPSHKYNELIPLLLIFFMLTIEWFGRDKDYAIATLGYTWPRPLRWLFYSSIIFVVAMFMQTGEMTFIYFHF
jgi:alginate O-acetyltransferase complex protein AlgI